MEANYIAKPWFQIDLKCKAWRGEREFQIFKKESEESAIDVTHLHPQVKNLELTWWKF